MASIIKIKRSSGNASPATLGSGELAYSWDEAGGYASGKLWIGTGSETDGAAANIEVIGGKLFTNMLDHQAGVLTANSAIVVDANKKIDDLLVDNLELNGNTLSSTNTNGNISIVPNGTGKTIVSNLYIGDDQTSLTEFIQDISGGTLLAGEGIDLVYDDNLGTTTISAEDATTDNKGIASFNTNHFTVTSGAVSAKTVTLGTTTLTLGSTINSLGGLQSLSVDNLLLDGNTISASNTNGGIVLAPNGTGTVDVSSKRITNLAEPVQDTDAATKYYVDAARSGLDVKASVRAATTAPITLAGVQLIDDVSLVEGDRVLVKDQTNKTQNGIYIVQASTWTRASDADNNPGGEVTSGMFTFVEAGTANNDCGFVLTTADPITLGTSELEFTLFSSSGSLIAGSGLSKAGNTLQVNVAATGGIEIVDDNLQLKSSLAGAGLTYTNGVLDVVGTTDRISVTANALDIASTYVGQASITTLGTITSGTWNATTVSVPYGGTGLTAVTSRGILFGNGTSALGVTGVSTIDGSFLREDSTGNPYWSNIIDGGTY